ncbi:MAG: hypothetical protein WCJ03_04955 [Bacteroidales bacterium]
MYKWIIILLLTTTFSLQAKESLDFLSTDSITYQCYLKGDWDKLISTGKRAIADDIDFKRLRQRMGYAYFVKQDYFAAKVQYEMALKLDETDADTRAFLYYCGMYIGDEDFARFHAAKLSDEIRQSLNMKRFKLIDAVDLEYNKKTNNTDYRSNPIYARIGLKTRLGYRLSLYQSLSKYSQGVVLNPDQGSTNSGDTNYQNDTTSQLEYYTNAKWSLDQHTVFTCGYHYVVTTVRSPNFYANLYYAGINSRFNRVQLGMNASMFKSGMGSNKQLGLTAGITLPTKSDINLTGLVSLLNQNDKSLTNLSKNRLVYHQSVSGKIANSLWGMASATFGNIKNYNDNEGLYLYNSLDATVFRTGLTFFWNLTDHIMLYTNYSLDKKERIDWSTGTTNYTSIYYQQSFLGGIRWKL